MFDSAFSTSLQYSKPVINVLITLRACDFFGALQVSLSVKELFLKNLLPVAPIAAWQVCFLARLGAFHRPIWPSPPTRRRESPRSPVFRHAAPLHAASCGPARSTAQPFSPSPNRVPEIAACR